MAMPSVTDAELVGLDTAGQRRVVDSSLIRRMYARTLWLAQNKPTIHAAWGDGLDCAAIQPQLSYTVTTGPVPEWEIGVTTVPAVGNETGVVRLYIHQTEHSSGTVRAGLRVRPVARRDSNLFPWLDLGTFVIDSTNGWRSGTFTVPSVIRDEPFDVQVYLRSNLVSVVTVIDAWSLCSDGTAWSRDASLFGEHLRRTTGPVDDVYTLRTMRDLQAESAAIPRVLAHHSFRAQQGSGDEQVALYVVPAPLTNAPITVHAYCDASGGTSADVSAAIVTTDPAPGLFPTAQDTVNFAPPDPGWRTLTVTPTAGVTNYLYVWVVPQGGHTGHVYSVYARQDDVADNALVLGVPARRILPVSERDAVPGAAIVNAWSGGAGGETPSADETIQNLWTDRFAMLNNASWWAVSRGHVVLPGDWCRPATYTTDAYDLATIGLDEVAFTKVDPSFAATRMRVVTRVTTDGTPMTAGERVLLVGNYDSTETLGVSQPIPSARMREGGTAAVEYGNTGDIYFAVGYLDSTGQPAAGTAPVRVSAGAAWELPPAEDANLVHFRGYSDDGIAIPDNDTVTGATDTIVCSRAFPVGMARVHVVLDHAAPATVKLTLSDGTTTVILADFGDLSADGPVSFSDSWADDITSNEALSAFRGSTSAATWTLTAYDDTAGTTGSVTAWALELW